VVAPPPPAASVIAANFGGIMKTITIDVENCWTATQKTLKEKYLEAVKLGKDAIAAFKRLKIVISY
jgi:hypothetical protein